MYKYILIALLSAGCALAQNEPPNNKVVTVQLRDPGELAPPNLFYFPVSASTSPVTGAPYSAESTTERIQVLGDGNRIDQTTSGNIARDNQGRVRSEAVPGGMALAGATPPHLITIDDPVAGYRYTLDTDHKIAFKTPAVKNLTLDVATVKTAGKVQIVGKAGDTPDENVTKTDLGSQTMEGVLVQGTRLTRTIAAGHIGNELPIVITTETWYSPDLKVLVMSKSSDPRIGETTYRLTNIQRSEPSAALFEVPGDYTIKEGPSTAVFYQRTGAPKE